MRCEECGRVIKNAHMWQLGGDIHAPTSRSMRMLCWECRERASLPEDERAASDDSSDDVLAQADEVVRAYVSRTA
ncbi:MAG: hypothetical protein KGO05_11200 [Chloroflexota bacterium]|nr:hypothetical protein [Chloroflexota bacterium]